MYYFLPTLQLFSILTNPSHNPNLNPLTLLLTLTLPLAYLTLAPYLTLALAT